MKPFIIKGNYKVGDTYMGHKIVSVFDHVESKKLLGVEIEYGYKIVQVKG